eukprot:jgi/Ulvmu1/393/UM001_0400.1
MPTGATIAAPDATCCLSAAGHASGITQKCRQQSISRKRFRALIKGSNMAPKRFRGDLDSSSGSDTGDDDELASANKNPQPLPKKIQVDPAALERAGYKAGPSVLHVPEQRSKAGDVWDWAAERKASVIEQSPTPEERAELRVKSEVGVEQDAEHYKKCMERARHLRDDKIREKEDKAKRKQLSFKEKEKRKRDAGMQSSAKNYVEEEKRIAREHGCYTGFDS